MSTTSNTHLRAFADFLPLTPVRANDQIFRMGTMGLRNSDATAFADIARAFAITSLGPAGLGLTQDGFEEGPKCVRTAGSPLCTQLRQAVPAIEY